MAALYMAALYMAALYMAALRFCSLLSLPGPIWERLRSAERASELGLRGMAGCKLPKRWRWTWARATSTRATPATTGAHRATLPLTYACDCDLHDVTTEDRSGGRRYAGGLGAARQQPPNSAHELGRPTLAPHDAFRPGKVAGALAGHR
eukprot:9486148-Pyramimonas_sp.AAC.1